MHANGAPWNEEACYEAADGGHLEVLVWLRANGCPWDGDVLGVARGHILDWVEENGLSFWSDSDSDSSD